MSHDHQADLQLAIEAVRAAGEAIMPAFHAGQEVRYKAPDQPVTDADEAADRILRERLLGARPDYGWLSEETKDSPERLGKRRVWVVDPIDGTTSFVIKRPEFGISVALVEEGLPVVGVIHNPATGETFWATLGGGAFRDGTPIRVTERDDARALRMIGSHSEIRRGGLDVFGDRWTLDPVGSTTYKMAKIAAGKGDAFVGFGPKNEWDVAAGDLIVSEAGGRVSDLAGRRFRYNCPETAWRGVVASNGAVHAGVVEVIGRM